MDAPGPPRFLDLATWERINTLVGEALDRAPADRPSFLAAVEPEALATEVAALVAAHEAAESTGALLSPFEPEAPEADDGARLGPYRITGRLGAGGMGTVYRAERADGAFDRAVALKVVRHAGAALTRRFARERRALARLEHPNIARLYDAGVADDGPLGGTPYLAMECVEGQPITDYAEARRLGVADRVRLLLPVCEAVAYAHRRLVLHRDLKPTNVLVADTDGGPRPVVLDFGIAKLLDPAGPEADDALTIAGGPLTPAYAAPEQIAGGDVTTAADVYGLGALLYELLTGRRPVPEVGAAEAPSPQAAAPPDRPVPADLDVVCRTALAPDPARRYASAGALADDLRRSLDGRPIDARPATAGYRLVRFVRRNVGMVAVVASSVLLLATVIASYAARLQAERDRAEARFEIAREAARAMLYDVHDAVAGLPGSTSAREAIVDRSLDYLRRLTAEAADDPALAIDLAGAYLRIGNVQGNPTDNNLGRPAEARASYRRGLALIGALPNGLPDSLAAAASGTEGRLWEKMGVVVAHTVAPDSALPDLDRAIAAQRRALAHAPDDADRRAYLAASHINRADYTGHPYFPNAGRPDSARAHYRRARALLASISDADHTLFSLRMLGITSERAGTLLRHEGRLDEAVGPTREALRMRERIAARRDANTDAYRDVGVSNEALAFLFAETGQLDDAYAGLAEAQAIYDALLEADPENVSAQQTVGIGHLNLARFLAEAGRPLGRRAEARRHATEAADRLGDLARRLPDNARLQALAAEAEALRGRAR